MESDVEGGVASASGGREGFRGAVMVVADGWFVGAKMGEMWDFIVRWQDALFYTCDDHRSITE